jgi:hypothetical protein
MLHVIASYPRKIWDMNWLFDGKHGFRKGYSCESQVITVCQDIADSLDNGGRTDAITIDFSKAFDLVPHWLLTKIAKCRVDSRAVALIREFLLGSTKRVKLGGQLSRESGTARKCIGFVTVPCMHK